MSKLDGLLKEFCPNGVEYKNLRDVATISRGGSFQKKDYVEKGFPCIHYGQIYTFYGLFADETLSYISNEVAAKQKKANKNDIVMAVTSENIEDVCKCVAWLGEGEIAVSGHAAIIQHSLNPKYLTYFLHSSMFYRQKIKLAHGTKVLEVKPDSLGDIILPVPPLEVQREIVRILDNFTELTAELTVRKKQYEYYRDTLLSAKKDVPVVKLKDVASIDRGVRLVKSQLNESGKYPVYQNALVPLGYYDERNRSGNNTFMISAGAAGQIGFSDIDFWAADDCYTFNCCEKLENKFLFHVLKNNQYRIDAKVRKASIPRISKESVGDIQIPLPSLEIQKKVVTVLDNFEKICNDLNIGLPGEIEARQKQYEFYRDQLLTFAENGETILTDRQTELNLIKLLQYVFGYAIVQLNTVIKSLNTGLNPRQFFKLNTEDASNYYITIREIVNGRIVPTEKTDRINDDAMRLCNNRSNLEAGDVLFSGTGTLGETAVLEETPVNWNIKEGVYVIKPEPTFLCSKYLRYILMTKKIKDAYMKKAAGGTVKSIPMKDLRLLSIPLPSMEKQRELVEVIDRFDVLCNDLSAGLPAEIEARQKQYEYYRDKLLSFKEAE